VRSISLGRHLRNTTAHRVEVADLDELARVLAQHRGAESWWSPHVWTGDRRRAEAWEGAAYVALDLDHADAHDKHSAPAAELAAALALAIEQRDLACSAWHRTPRGARILYALDEPCTDAELYRAAVDGARAEVGRVLRDLGLAAETGRAGFYVDDAALDLARLLWSPRALVPGEPAQRDAEVHVVGATWAIEALAEMAPAPLATAGVDPWVAEAPSVPQDRTTAAPATLDASEEVRLLSALAWLDPVEYGQWLAVGMAIHDASGASELGFSLWSRWSLARRELYDAAETARKWKSFHVDHARPITLGSIYKLAEARGWRPRADAPLPAAIEPAFVDDAEMPERWLAERPPARRWLVRHPDDAGAIPLGRAGALAGEGGIGKSWCVTSLAVAVATGRRWLRHFRVDSAAPRGVLLALAEENEEECWRRIWHCADELGLSDHERELVRAHVHVYPLAGRDVALLALVDRDKVEETVHLRSLRDRLARGGPWGLVVLDPLARFAGVDAEASNLLATRLVQAVEGLAESPGEPTVLVVAHSSKLARRGGTVDARGVTALTDGLRWAFGLAAVEGSTDAVELVPLKSNYASQRGPLVLRRHDHGVLVVETEDEARERTSTTQTAVQKRRAQKDAQEAELHRRRVARVVEVVTSKPGVLTEELIALVGAKDRECRRAIAEAIATGQVAMRLGARGAHFHYPPNFQSTAAAPQTPLAGGGARLASLVAPRGAPGGPGRSWAVDDAEPTEEGSGELRLYSDEVPEMLDARAAQEVRA
jgi:hypothetical protein